MKKIFVLGLDALSPKILTTLIKKGSLPNFKRLLEIGGFSKALPAVPAQTPENWTTIATGAWPGTHGIAVWGRHDYGQPVTQKFAEEAMSSNLCKAEYLWEALGRQGLRSVLLYFVGYPPTTDKVIYIDWFWKPGDFYFEICNAMCYSNYIPESLKEAPRRALAYFTKIKFKRAQDWKNLPKSELEPLEAKIEVKPKMEGSGVKYYILLIGSKNKGYDKCLLCKERDALKAVCTLRSGEWSPWFKEGFIVKGKQIVGTVRFKLIELAKDASKFKLYRSQVYPIKGFTYPPEIGEELVDNFGPYVNEAVARLFFVGLVDEATMIEELRYQINWIAKAAKYLMEKSNASLFIMHWHLLDLLQHRVLGLVDPRGGMYDPNKAEEAWRILELCYRLADELIGKFMEFLDENTYLIVVSDHGNVPNRKKHSIVNALAKKGLIVVEEVNGEKRINWSKSKVFIDLTNVYVNLKSRYKGGIVEDSEYEKVRNKVLEILRELKDEDGEYVVAFALKREDAVMIGLWGEHVGDIVFAYSLGFTWGHRELFEGTLRVGGANHGPQIPTAETELSSNYGTFIIAGPNIKKGYIRPVEFLGPVYLVDIAPTIAYILNVNPPRHNQGRILYDFFEGWDISEVKRKRIPLEFPKLTVPIKGDVTDIV